MSIELNGYSIDSYILCEQIRQEIRNKVSIIGVFSADIVVSEFPSTFPVTIYLEIDAQTAGKIELNVRLISPGPNIVEMKVVGELASPGRSYVPLPPMPLVCAEAGSVTVEVSDGGELWHVLMARKVQAGDVDAQQTGT